MKENKNSKREREWPRYNYKTPKKEIGSNKLQITKKINEKKKD